MGIIRGKIWHDREIVPKYVTVGGEWPFWECDCGGWVSKESGEHAEVVSLEDLLLTEMIHQPVKCSKK